MALFLISSQFVDQELQHHFVTIHVLPVRESYDIGSRVTFNCTITPTPTDNEGMPLSIAYNWYSVPSFVSSSVERNTLTVTLQHYYPDTYYCRASHNGRLLGIQKTTLKLKGIEHSYCIGTGLT